MSHVNYISIKINSKGRKTFLWGLSAKALWIQINTYYVHILYRDNIFDNTIIYIYFREYIKYIRITKVQEDHSFTSDYNSKYLYCILQTVC